MNQLSLMGTTFLISSGDTGVAGFNKKCISESGLKLKKGGSRFVPFVGNTCPYVTSVGATQIKKGRKAGSIIEYMR